MHSPARLIYGLFALLFGLGALAALALWLATAFDAPAAASTPRTHRVTYQIVTAECVSFSVTYRLPGGTAQRDVTACPDSSGIAEFRAAPGDFVYLSAQNSTRADIQRPFACRILVDNRALAEVQSVGFAKIASCSGTIP